MSSRNKFDIGFGKKIRALWLDLSLEHAASGRSFSQVKDELIGVVRRDNPGSDAIRKVLVCLNRVWFEPPNYCRVTRDAGLKIYLESRTPQTRLLLNWGMAVAAYPFVGAVAETVGRLLKLQGTFGISDIKRRMNERFGDRDFVRRIVRYDVSSFLDWGVLSETKIKGEYIAGNLVSVDQPNQMAWLSEAILHSQNETSLPIAQLRQHPMLFPFKVREMEFGLSNANPRLHTLRHGHTEDLVMLREN
jgi:hypothetical protein